MKSCFQANSQMTIKKQGQELWQEVTSILNSIPGGSNKCWFEWRKTWQDMKKNVKSKAVAEKRYATGTGRLAKNVKFDDTESKILSIISPKVTFGDTCVSVSNISFDFGQGYSDVTASEERPTPEPTLFSPELELEDVITLTVEEENKIPATTPTTFSTPQKRYVKGKRLEHSIEISKQLLKIEEKKNALIICNEEKRKYFMWRKEYETEKLKYLRSSIEIQANILKEIRDMKEYLS